MLERWEIEDLKCLGISGVSEFGAREFRVEGSRALGFGLLLVMV